MISMSSQPYDEPETIPISYLNAYVYCPRRFYYEFVQSDMLENEFVLEGTLLHQRVDMPGQHTIQDKVQTTRIYLYSDALRLSGFADLVEEENGVPVPTEYKHGKEGRWINDHVQLCAQAMCLEERLPGTVIPHGYIFYFGSRKRVCVELDRELRARTHDVIAEACRVAVQPTPPPPLEGKMALRCRDCSLQTLCLPNEVRFLHEKGKGYADIVLD